MEDIIAVKALDRAKGCGGFLTWGRVFDRTNGEIVAGKLAEALGGFGFHEIESIKVCESLQEVAKYPYFYEALIRMSWKPIPFGKKYNAWAAKKRKEITAGKEIYFLGLLKTNRRQRLDRKRETSSNQGAI